MRHPACLRDMSVLTLLCLARHQNSEAQTAVKTGVASSPVVEEGGLERRNAFQPFVVALCSLGEIMRLPTLARGPTYDDGPGDGVFEDLFQCLPNANYARGLIGNQQVLPP
jgi:hypothetical protein